MLNRCKQVFLLTFADMWYNVICTLRMQNYLFLVDYIINCIESKLFTWHLSITLISCRKKAKDWFLKFLLEISMLFFRIKASKFRKNYCNSLHPQNFTFGKLLWFDDLLILKQVLVSVFYALCFRWACSLLSIIGYWVKCGIVVLKWFSMP